MKTLIDLGRATEETKGQAFNTDQLDSTKLAEGGQLYNCADPSIADGVRVENPA